MMRAGDEPHNAQEPPTAEAMSDRIGLDRRGSVATAGGRTIEATPEDLSGSRRAATSRWVYVTGGVAVAGQGLLFLVSGSWPSAAVAVLGAAALGWRFSRDRRGSA